MIIDDIIIIISKYVLFNEYKNISQTNKKYNKFLLNNIPIYIKKEYAINNLNEYPIKLLELFNPIKLYNTPICNIKKIGHGDYIDFLNITNFKNTNIIRGIDKYKRPFISFLYNQEKNIITTLFQRYTEDKYRWVSGGRTPLYGNTIVVDFDNYYKETDDINILINFFNNN